MATKAEIQKARVRRVEAFRERVKKPEIFQLDPVVAVTLKGKAFTMEYDLKAAKDVLQDCGFNVLSMPMLDAYDSPDILGSLLHRGLQRHQEGLSREEADRLFSMRQHPYITQMIEEALTLFNPDLSDVPIPESDEAPVDPQP